jgi:glycosyltransferase involved in cell wall biosynthesis
MMSHLVNTYAARGHQVQVFTTSWHVSRPVEASSGQITVTVIPVSKWKILSFSIPIIWQMSSFIKRSRCDVLHAHWLYEYALASLMSGVRSLITAHDDPLTIARYDRHILRMVKTPLGVIAARLARHVTAPSPYIAASVSRLTAAPISVVPNGLPAGLMKAPQQKPNGSAHILSICNEFGNRKNTAGLLRSFQLVRRAMPQARLTVIGDHHQQNGRAHQFAVEHDLTTGVSFLGRQPQPEILRLMDNADLLIHPSREESFGMVLIEAMARGLPVLAGRDSGATAWILGEGRFGWLADVGDVSSLADAAIEALIRQDVSASRAEAAFRHVKENFLIDRVADQYLQRLDDLSASIPRVSPVGA